MFNLGDTVVYPCQGIGIIDSIEEREFKGEKQDYYSIHILNNTMKLTLPASRAEAIHIRLISNSKTIDNTLENINKFVTDKDELKKNSTKERMAINSEKMKSGTLENYLCIIYDLNKIKAQSNLNINENQLFNNAKSFVLEEICQSKHLTKDEAKILLNQAIKYDNYNKEAL